MNKKVLCIKNTLLIYKHKTEYWEEFLAVNLARYFHCKAFPHKKGFLINGKKADIYLFRGVYSYMTRECREVTHNLYPGKKQKNLQEIHLGMVVRVLINCLKEFELINPRNVWIKHHFDRMTVILQVITDRIGFKTDFMELNDRIKLRCPDCREKIFSALTHLGEHYKKTAYQNSVLDEICRIHLKLENKQQWLKESFARFLRLVTELSTGNFPHHAGNIKEYFSYFYNDLNELQKDLNKFYELIPVINISIFVKQLSKLDQGIKKRDTHKIIERSIHYLTSMYKSYRESEFRSLFWEIQTGSDLYLQSIKVIESVAGNIQLSQLKATRQNILYYSKAAQKQLYKLAASLKQFVAAKEKINIKSLMNFLQNIESRIPGEDLSIIDKITELLFDNITDKEDIFKRITE